MLPAFERKKILHGLKFGGNKNGNCIILLYSGSVLIQFTTQFRTTRLTTSLQTKAALKKKQICLFSLRIFWSWRLLPIPGSKRLNAATKLIFWCCSRTRGRAPLVQTLSILWRFFPVSNRHQVRAVEVWPNFTTYWGSKLQPVPRRAADSW